MDNRMILIVEDNPDAVRQLVLYWLVLNDSPSRKDILDDYTTSLIAY